MKYYKIMYDSEKSEKKNYILCKEAFIGDIDRYDIKKGQKIDNWDNSYYFNMILKKGLFILII